jgi:drug/metabolite transporter (DMT)-like permease
MSARRDMHVMPASLLWLLAAMTLMWGMSWPVMKIVLRELEPIRFRALALLFGCVGLFALAIIQKQQIRVPAGQWGRLFWLGFFNVTAWNFLAMFGLQLMSSGRAAIIAYTMPIWAALFGIWFGKEPFTSRRLLGIGLGMGGMVLLVSGEFHSMQRAPLGAFYLLVSAICWGFGTVMFRHWPVNLPATSLSAWQMLIAVVPVWLWTLAFDHGPFFPSQPTTWMALLYVLMVTSVFCIWAWTRIATAAPVAVSSLSTLMIPVVGVLAGMAMLGERPQWHDIGGLLFVLAALATVLVPSRRLSGAS